MTLKTWKKEFYPIPANRRMSRRKAIEHSLRKWEGLRKSNLKRHNVEHRYAFIESDAQWMMIDDSSCALCVKYVMEEENCLNCPLYKTLGKRCDDNNNMPYTVWRRASNPLPMIKALKATLKAEAQS